MEQYQNVNTQSVLPSVQDPTPEFEQLWRHVQQLQAQVSRQERYIKRLQTEVDRLRTICK